jgi:hypothetical protein
MARRDKRIFSSPRTWPAPVHHGPFPRLTAGIPSLSVPLPLTSGYSGGTFRHKIDGRKKVFPLFSISWARFEPITDRNGR